MQINIQILIIIVSHAFWVASSLKVNNAVRLSSQSYSSSKYVNHSSGHLTIGNTANLHMMTSSARSDVPVKLSKAVNTKLVLSLSLWYFISIFYNFFNKRALNALNMPWLIATIQMGLGVLLIPPIWFFKIRTTPFDSLISLIETMGFMKEVVVYQTITHVAGVVALGSGAVSFAHVIKSTEPICAALISAIFFRQRLSLKSYLSLIVVITGVAMASATELSFSWLSLWTGLLSSVFAAAKTVFAKRQMCGEEKCVEQLSPENYYAIMTMASFLFLVPLTIAMEWTKLSALGAAIQKGGVYMKSSGYKDGIINMFLSALCYYLYNELSFTVLGEVAPVTHAVANTLKRVFIIFSSILIFNTPFTLLGLVGSSLAIVGLFFYSLSQSGTRKMNDQKDV